MNVQYLSKELIKNDHERFAKHMKEHYDVEDCQVYEVKTNEMLQGEPLYQMGFVIKKEGKLYIVTMPFVENELGEFRIVKNAWEVQKDNGEREIDLPSLKEVHEAIGMNKIENSNKG